MITTPPLNQGQQSAADGFFEFLFSDDKELILNGPGGVGKTFLMSYLIDRVIPQYEQTCRLMGIEPKYKSVVMTATTNKAAEVLSSATNRPTSTIQSFLSLKVTEDYETGQSRLKKTPAWKVHEDLVLFVDEGSMIDSPLRRMILEGTFNCKIVYVGDHCQLAPVMEPLSPIYRDNLPMFTLTQPMRNAEQPALMALCDQFRQTVLTGTFSPIDIVPGVIDWLPADQAEILVASKFLPANHGSRILAYTNNQVNGLNDYIREVRQLPPNYTQGETLVCNSAIEINRNMIRVEEEVTVLHVDSSSTLLIIDEGAELEVVYATISTALGGVFKKVPLPVNKAHFADLVRYFSRCKKWATYFQLKNTFPDLRPRDACTVHKAQGSTYTDVLIDLGNISTCHNADQVARMLYVAVTRPKNRIILFGDLAPKYGSLRF